MSLKVLSLKYPEGIIKQHEIENSYGGMPLILDLMAVKYLGCQPHTIMLLNNELKKLWKLHKDKNVKESHRNVLRMTYDNIIILEKDFEKICNDIDEFLKDFTIEKNRENHLPKIKKIIQKSKKINGIGFQWNTVSENLFEKVWNEELGKYDELNWAQYYSLYDNKK